MSIIEKKFITDSYMFSDYEICRKNASSISGIAELFVNIGRHFPNSSN